jgi:type I restriction enzyme S subunit
MCDIDLTLPDLSEQRRYVAVYKSLLANQRAYERGLDDLKLTCDVYIENLRRQMPVEAIGKYITRIDERNVGNKIRNVKGVSVYKTFREPTSKVNTKELSAYKIVKPRQITFVQTTNHEKVFAYAFNNTEDDIVVTSVNEVFYCDENKLLPEYLSMFFNRAEFDRYARFHSWGSVRETFNWNDLCEVKIPIPDINVQRCIVDIYNACAMRKEINERLKRQIKDICPVLIRGSLEKN